MARSATRLNSSFGLLTIRMYNTWKYYTSCSDSKRVGKRNIEYNFGLELTRHIMAYFSCHTITTVSCGWSILISTLRVPRQWGSSDEKAIPTRTELRSPDYGSFYYSQMR